jgi:SAM-dependent methyltransferase
MAKWLDPPSRLGHNALMITDTEAAALYDQLNPWDIEKYAGDAFYHGLVMKVDAVLDVGCGTGSMLHHARSRGHSGRLVGLDPNHAILARALRRTDVEWFLGAAADAAWDREFDLATMTSHAFQCLTGDDELRTSLAAIRASLRDGGRFAFETRHPQARAWEQWNPSTVSFGGRDLRSWHEVESVDGDVVTFVSTVADPTGAVLRTDRSRLRFLDVAPWARS